jgi:putative tryptophan/tyrosine transport system substrate-binding protein
VSGLTRRRFVQGAGVAGCGLLAACGRLPGLAPPAARIPRIGLLTANSFLGEPFVQGLRELGYVEGQNVGLEWRVFTRPDDLPSLAAELVRVPVDVIVAPPSIAAEAAKHATSTIPIVFVTASDPVGSGLVDSLARPGGNVTGVSTLNVSLGEKRLELLKEAAPRTARIACIYEATAPTSVAEMQHNVQAAGRLGLTVEGLGVQAPEDFAHAFELATQLPADALMTTLGQFLLSQRQRIVDFAAPNRLPAIYAWREAVDAGGLMSYGPSLAAQFRRAAYYVARILQGTSPTDLPVEQPREFDFVINLKTAQALGLTIPQHVLAQATEVTQ